MNIQLESHERTVLHRLLLGSNLVLCTVQLYACHQNPTLTWYHTGFLPLKSDYSVHCQQNCTESGMLTCLRLVHKRCTKVFSNYTHC